MLAKNRVPKSLIVSVSCECDSIELSVHYIRAFFGLAFPIFGVSSSKKKKTIFFAGFFWFSNISNINFYLSIRSLLDCACVRVCLCVVRFRVVHKHFDDGNVDDHDRKVSTGSSIPNEIIFYFSSSRSYSLSRSLATSLSLSRLLSFPLALFAVRTFKLDVKRANGNNLCPIPCNYQFSVHDASALSIYIHHTLVIAHMHTIHTHTRTIIHIRLKIKPKFKCRVRGVYLQFQSEKKKKQNV